VALLTLHAVIRISIITFINISTEEAISLEAVSAFALEESERVGAGRIVMTPGDAIGTLIHIITGVSVSLKSWVTLTLVRSRPQQLARGVGAAVTLLKAVTLLCTLNSVSEESLIAVAEVASDLVLAHSILRAQVSIVGALINISTEETISAVS